LWYKYCHHQLVLQAVTGGNLMGISIWQLLVILAIVLLLFGAKRLRGLGADLGDAVKGFRQAMRDDTDSEDSVATPIAAGSKESSSV
jgi:sec-independent protein translocase protein TatA